MTDLRAAHEAATAFGDVDLADVVARCDVTTWIVLELLEADGVPVADEPYEVTLPGGELRTGRLDGNGRAVIDGIDPGIARVRFPARDDTDFGPSAHMPQAREGAPWIELELLDEHGVGIAGERYEVELADGTKRVGTLDEEGRARIEGVEEGECKVRFPDRDAADLERADVLGEPAPR